MAGRELTEKIMVKDRALSRLSRNVRGVRGRIGFHGRGLTKRSRN